jgi:hypothetical protein
MSTTEPSTTEPSTTEPGTTTEVGTTTSTTTTTKCPNNASNLTATALSKTEIELKWDDNSDNELNFFIERSESSDFLVIDVSYFLPADTTSFIDKKELLFGIVYYYRVRASFCTTYSNTAYAIPKTICEELDKKTTVKTLRYWGNVFNGFC